MGKVNVPTAIIGPTRGPWWSAIEELMLNNPTEWYSVNDLVEVIDPVPQSGFKSFVYSLSSTEVLRRAGRRGEYVYRLADHYIVAAIVSKR